MSLSNSTLEDKVKTDGSACFLLRNVTQSWVSPGDLLLDGLGIGLSKQIEHGAAEVVSVAVGVAKLVGNCIQEQVTS